MADIRLTRFGGLLIATCIALLTASPSTAQVNEEGRTVVSAEKVRDVPIPKAINVAFEGVPGPSEQMLAIFNDELQKHGYRLDPAAPVEMSVRWRGDFREGERPPRIRPLGQGGNQSRTELGLAITLGPPPQRDGEETYSIGASVSDVVGEIWKGKVITVSASTQRQRLMRRMTQNLLGIVGGTVAPDALPRGD